MTEFLLSMVYFLRPVAYAQFRVDVSGLSTLEIFAILSFVILLMLAITRLYRFKMSAIDLFIFLYAFWCIGAFFVYIDKAQVVDLAKFILPFFTYLVLKYAINSRAQYMRVLWLMIVGFSIPVGMTTILILLHKGVYVQDYWTGLFRFTGSYPNPHDLGHNMTFLLMLIVVYITLWRNTDEPMYRPLPVWRKVFLATLVILALFCLYKSYVRTAYLGLVAFFLVYLFFINKKLMLTAAAGLIVAVVAFWSVWALIFHDVVEVYQGERATENIGSGRPYIWKHNFEIFSNLSIDRQLAGVGVGNRSHVLSSSHASENIWNSHNDYLEVFMQTGIVGFIIFIIIQVLLFRCIRYLDKRERYVFMALFVAVAFMNFASNSYVTRFGLGQTFYMVFVYVEAKRRLLWRA